jgi:large subunit ribosomal protein L3
MKGLIGKKIGMTQIYSDDGTVVPVTVVQAGPCAVLDVKTREKDGYSALQLGFGDKKVKNTTKPLLGHLKKSGRDASPPSIVRELRMDSDSDAEVGSEIKSDVFSVDDYLDITGTTKGRGFQGVVKRYNFGGGRYSHGGGWKRKPGSIGQCEFPGRVQKGKKMPGHMGNIRKTVQNLAIIKVDNEEDLLFIKGAVPGPNGGTLLLRKARKKG